MIYLVGSIARLNLRVLPITTQFRPLNNSIITISKSTINICQQVDKYLFTKKITPTSESLKSKYFTIQGWTFLLNYMTLEENLIIKKDMIVQ